MSSSKKPAVQQYHSKMQMMYWSSTQSVESVESAFSHKQTSIGFPGLSLDVTKVVTSASN